MTSKPTIPAAALSARDLRRLAISIADGRAGDAYRAAGRAESHDEYLRLLRAGDAHSGRAYDLEWPAYASAPNDTRSGS